MFADVAPLIATLNLGGNFTSSLKKASKTLGSFDAKLDQTQSRAYRAGQQIGTGIKNAARIAAIGIGFVVSQVGLGLNSLIKLEQAQAQTAAVLKSTGQAAGITGAEITRLSEKFEGLNATVGDEFVRAGANMLLTFTNIRGKAFEPALQAVLNMNTAMGKGPEGLTTTAILVGKALNDPIKGATALRRVGVQLDDQQVKQIKTLIKQNKLYEAQGIILAELNKEFGGSFAAQGDTTAGKVAKFTDAIEDLQRALAEALLPTLGNVADALTKTLADPSVIQGVRDFGKSLAGLVSPANLATAGRILGDVFSAAKSAAPVIAAAAKTMFSVVSAAVKVFSSLPKEIQQLAIGAFAINKLTGGLVTNIAGGLIGGVLKQLVAGVVNVRGATVVVTGAAGLGGAGAAGGALAAGSVWSTIGKVIGGAFAIVAVAAIAEQIHSFTSREGGLRGRINAGTELPGDKLQWPWGPKNTPRWVIDSPFGPINLLGGDSDLPKAGTPSPDWFNKLKHVPITAPTFPDSPRTSPLTAEALEGLLARGRAAGFKPTVAAALSTNQKNLERLAAAQLAKAEAIRSTIAAGDPRPALAGIQSAVHAAAARQPVTNVKVEVNVTAAQVSKSIVIQPNGPPSKDDVVPRRGTSRHQSPKREFASGAWDLGSDQDARVHKGEMIVPAAAAAMMRGLARRGGRIGRGTADQAAMEEALRRAAEKYWLAEASRRTSRLRDTSHQTKLHGPDERRDGLQPNGPFVPGVRLDASQVQDRRPPVVNVTTNVNVTAAQVSKSVVIQNRYGPSGGSRDSGSGIPGSGR